MNVVFVSNLFPNRHEPTRGIFNFHQMRALAAFCSVRVVAPIARSFVRSRHVTPHPVPSLEQIGPFEVRHPTALYLPQIGRSLNAWLFAVSVGPTLNRLIAEFSCDVLLANWAYPDACGVAQVAEKLRIPFVASCSGSDLNVGLTFAIRRRQILRMTRSARAVTVRSRALKELLIRHGAAPATIHVLYNGVDRELFHPSRLNRQMAYRRLVYIGRLSPEKGLDDLIAALKQLAAPPPLVVIGDGPQRAALQRAASGLPVLWLGMKRNEEIAPLLGVSDIVCIPSHREGVPNAALEAFACGLPVVATRVGGIPEVVTPTTGVLAEPNNPDSLNAAIREALAQPWDTTAILAHAARFDWSANARALLGILQQAVA